jgi:hypothetical protein
MTYLQQEPSRAPHLAPAAPKADYSVRVRDQHHRALAGLVFRRGGPPTDRGGPPGTRQCHRRDIPAAAPRPELTLGARSPLWTRAAHSLRRAEGSTRIDSPGSNIGRELAGAPPAPRRAARHARVSSARTGPRGGSRGSPSTRASGARGNPGFAYEPRAAELGVYLGETPSHFS